MKKAILGVMLALMPIAAIATGNTPRCDDGSCNDTEQHQGQQQGQHQGQRQTAEGGDGGQGGTAHSNATGGEASANAMSGANNEGVSTDIDASYRSESNNTNVVLVPNNNTSNCMRVWGISFGTSDGAAGLGIPTRDEGCDLDDAADDAAAMGEHDIAWYWRCQKKHLYRRFEGDGREEKARACHEQMRNMMSQPGSDEPVPTGQVIIPEDEYESLLLAQVQQEELDEQRELAEYRYAQQQNLIDALQEDHEDDQAEIDRLKREAAELRAAQEAEAQEDADIREQFRARLRAREEAGEDGEEDDDGREE